MRDVTQVTPRGVQLVLGTEQEPALVDTLVMSNLGYFQLKARPGALALQLAQGRSRMLYAVDASTQGVAPQVCQSRPLPPDQDMLLKVLNLIAVRQAVT